MFAGLALTFCFGVAHVFAQNQVKTIGNVFVEVKKGSFDLAIKSDLVIIPSFANDSAFFSFPVKDRIPLSLGGTLDIFFCHHCVNYQVTVSAFHKTESELTVYVGIQTFFKQSLFNQKFKLKKGETKILELKNDFSLRANYRD